MIRTALAVPGAALLLAVTLAAPLHAQDQGMQGKGSEPGRTGTGSARPVYDLVAADRETAWRINRETGEVTVCRVDTTATLDGVRARCAPVIEDRGPQQARTPADGGINRP